MPPGVIAAARANLTDPQKQLADHLARVDRDLQALQRERRQAMEERMAAAEADRRLRAREESVRQREDALRRRLDAKVDEQVRLARREIDTVIEGLKARAAELSQQAEVRLRAGDKVRAVGISTGETGGARADARAALDAVLERLTGRPEGRPLPDGNGRSPRDAAEPPSEDARRGGPSGPPAVEPGMRVTVGTLGLEGVVVEVHGKHAEVDVRGKRLRAPLRDLKTLAGAPSPKVHVSVDLQPRSGSLSELNVVGNTVDEALSRLEKFLDEVMVSDIRELRIVHGYGTGQLRRAIQAFLKEHPLVARFDQAPQNQGGGGATIVELKD
jgi:DNA mismatch repair protein MutS2